MRPATTATAAALWAAALLLLLLSAAPAARGQVQSLGQAASYITVEFLALEQVAKSVASMIEVLGDDLSPKHLADIVKLNVKADHLIYGSAIAFMPGTYNFSRHDITTGVADANNGTRTAPDEVLLGGANYSLYCPYAYRGEGFRENPNREPYSFDLADGYSYVEDGTEWFLNPFFRFLDNSTDASRGGYWTAPYFDAGAGGINMVTFSVPFYSKTIDLAHLDGHLARFNQADEDGNRPWGIATIDIPIGDLVHWTMYSLPGWAVIVPVAMASLVTLANAAFAGVTYKFRASTLMRASSPPFLYTILLASTAAAWSALTFVLPVDEDGNMCHYRMWFVSISVMTMFSALFLKTYRIARIFTQGIKAKKMSNGDLFRGLAMIVGAQILILTAATAIPSQRSEYEVEQNDSISTDGTYYEVEQCTSSQAGVMLTFLMFAGLSVWGIVLAYRVRGLPSQFNEASYISTALAFVVIMAVLVVPVQFLVDKNPEARALLRSMGLVLTAGVTTAVLFAPKLMTIKDGHENDRVETNASVRTAVGSTNSKRGRHSGAAEASHSRKNSTTSTALGAGGSARRAGSRAASPSGAPSLRIDVDKGSGGHAPLRSPAGNPSSAPGSPAPVQAESPNEVEMGKV